MHGLKNACLHNSARERHWKSLIQLNKKLVPFMMKTMKVAKGCLYVDAHSPISHLHSVIICICEDVKLKSTMEVKDGKERNSETVCVHNSFKESSTSY